MKKILNFFSSLGEKIIGLSRKIKSWLLVLKDRIFPKQAEERKRAKLIRWVIIGVVVIVLIVLIGWLVAAKFWLKTSPSSSTAPIAEAKLYVISAGECGNKCWDTQLFADALTNQGIKIVSTKKYNIGGWWPFDQGTELAKEFKITKLPTVIVEFTGKNQPDINKFFSPTLGNVLNGKFVLTKILAPYYDSIEKKLKGLIKVTYLTDKSCTQCYDVKKHETALKNLGAFPTDSQTIDVSTADGQALLAKYSITKVPTVLVAGEVSEYSVLTQAWKDVGFVATDGTYVFTATDLMGDYYRDLKTNKVIQAKATTATK